MSNLIRLDSDKLGPLAKRYQVFLNGRIKGQERAVKDAVATLDFYESGFNSQERPIHSALLLGPSGVGKTFLAELLAEFLFGQKQALTIIDCGEYQSEHHLNTLLGSSLGYIGSDVLPLLAQENIDQYDFARQKREQALANNNQNLEEVEKLESLMMTADVLRTILSQLGSHSLIPRDRINLRKITDDLSGVKYRLRQLSADKNSVAVQNAALDIAEVEKIFHVWIDTRTDSAILHITERLLKVVTEIGIMRQKQAYSLGYDPNQRYLSVILFDEIEKAHEAVWKALLQILDKGRAKMKNTETTDFTNSFIFMTSNVGSKKISDILSKGGMGFDTSSKEESAAEFNKTDQDIYDEAMRELEKEFTIEFLNRFDNKIVFRPLGRKIIKEILEVMLKDLQNSLIEKEFAILLRVDEEVKGFIVEKSVKRMREGVRLLRRRVEHYITGRLGRLKNSGELKEGDIVRVRLDNGKVVFFREPRAKKQKLAG